MRALYLHKLKQEKEGKLGKGRKADRAPCHAWHWSDCKLLLSSMNAFDKAPKLQGKDWVESEQISLFSKCRTNSNVTN